MFNLAVAICRAKDLIGRKFTDLFFLYEALSKKLHDSDLAHFLNNNNFLVILGNIQKVSSHALKDPCEIRKIEESLKSFLGKLKGFKESSQRSYNCYWETGENVVEAAYLKAFSQEDQDKLYFSFYFIVSSIREILKSIELAECLLEGEREESMKQFDPDVH